MLRSPQILAWTCPIRTHRPLLLGVRDSHLPAQPEPPCQRWNRPRAGRSISLYQGNGRMGRGGEEEALHSQEAVSLYLTISSQMYNCESSVLNPTAQEPSSNAAPSNCPQLSQDFFKRTPRFLGLTSAPWKTTALEHLGYAKATDCYNEIKCLIKNSQTERCQHSSAVLNNDLQLSVKSKTNISVQGVTFLKHNFFRMHGSTILKPWSLDLTGTLSRPPSLSLLQSRGLQQAVPHQDTLKYCLSIENEARCRQSLGPNTALYEKDRGRRGAQEKWAAVLISLCFVQGEPAFLFTLRSSRLKGRHKGDVSFAGGKRDPSDKDVVDTALREAQEELGVTVAADRVWGVLKPLRDMSGMMIAPVLANLGPLEALSFKPNPGEVEEIFTLSLSHVCSPQNRGYTHFRMGERYGYTLPVFRNGKHRVWGLTAVALDHTLKLIVPP